MNRVRAAVLPVSDLDVACVAGDRNPDIVSNTFAQLSVLPGRGDGPSTTGQSRTVDTNANAGVAVKTKGVRPSLASVWQKGTHSGRAGLFVLPPAGGGLGAPANLGGPGSDVRVGDLNTDTSADLATIGDAVIGLFPDNGNGIFASAGSIGAGQSAFGLAAGDVTAKASIDLIELDPTNPQQVVVYRNSTPR